MLSIRLSPTNAKRLLALNTYPGQRKPSAAWTADLEAKMRDGRFHEGLVAMMDNNGDSAMMNGQKQCEAVIRTGVSVPSRLHEYKAEDGDSVVDIATVFAQYDVHQPRTRGHIAWIYGAQVGMNDWPSHCVQLCAAALGVLEVDGPATSKSYAKPGKDRMGAVLVAHKPDCRFVYDVAFAKGSCPHIRRSHVIVAMIATWRKAKSSAGEFWAAVRDGEMLTKTSPAYKCREFLLNSVCRTSAIPG
ncbi:unnamed protein product, partial [marine sediment metagenome]